MRLQRDSRFPAVIVVIVVIAILSYIGWSRTRASETIMDPDDEIELIIRMNGVEMSPKPFDHAAHAKRVQEFKARNKEREERYQRIYDEVYGDN